MVSHLDPRPDIRGWAETAAAFYRRERPEAHFRTSSSTSPLLADALVALLAEYPDIGWVVDVGAGGGTLLQHLYRRRPDLALTGIDQRDRPDGLDPAVGWLDASVQQIRPRQRGQICLVDVQVLSRPGLLLACELLDDVPGDRPALWVDLFATLARSGGLALAVDYVTPADGPGPLLAYRDGQQVEPVLAPDRNLTAPVDLDAVRRAGEAAGARTLAYLRQADALDRWLPPRPFPADPLADLVRRSEHHALTSPTWFGDHWWLLQQVPALR